MHGPPHLTPFWLAVTGVAMMILFAQMGRVQDSWPHRKDDHAPQQTQEASAQEPPSAQ